jgi:glutaredoxin
VNYLLFTWPNCAQCDSLKKNLSEIGFTGEEFNLVKPEGKKKLREYIKNVKRDDKGSVIIPTLLILEENEVQTAINSSGELENWLKSKD